MSRPPAANISHDRITPRSPSLPTVGTCKYKGFQRMLHCLSIMHVIAIRREVYENNRWVIGNLMRGFEEAKRRNLARVANITASSVPLLWVSDFAAQSRQIMDPDFWPYSVETDEATLSTFIRYAWEQGVTARRIAVEDIFVPEALPSVRV